MKENSGLLLQLKHQLALSALFKVKSLVDSLFMPWLNLIY